MGQTRLDQQIGSPDQADHARQRDHTASSSTWHSATTPSRPISAG